MIRLLLNTTFFLIFLHGYGQDFSYKHYSAKDGPGTSTIYDVLQDKTGFMWFATNQGVCRFDGHNFEQFTREDGLPDNEIVKLYLDKFNNVWFISMIGTPSVFTRNKIRRFEGCVKVTSVVEDLVNDSLYLLSGYDTSYGFYKTPNINGGWTFTPHLGNLALQTEMTYGMPILKASGKAGVNFYFSIHNYGVPHQMVIESIAKNRN